jgi:RimJ/RimL family protein N-acetyltransferase
VVDDDVGIFFEYQFEAGASEMAAFPTRSKEEHFAHWSKIRADPNATLRTIAVGSDVAGNVVSWRDGARRLVGYWVGKAYWGRGIATTALRQFLAETPERPLHAYVAAHNVGSIRVLEKCGFEVVHHSAGTGGDEGDVEELLMELRAEQ